MKMVSSLLESMTGIHIFYVIGLLLFITLFIIIFIRTMRRPASEMNAYKESIFNENDPEGSERS